MSLLKVILKYGTDVVKARTTEYIPNYNNRRWSFIKGPFNSIKLMLESSCLTSSMNRVRDVLCMQFISHGTGRDRVIK